MTPARHHAEWLSLVESSGPFLSMPVLLRVFPQGLDHRDSTRAAALRENYEDWLERGRPLLHVHTAWIRHVLENLLEWPADFIAEGQSIPAGLEASQPHFGETLRPDFVLRRPPGSEGDAAPQILVTTYSPIQDLEKPVNGKIWKASPATRMTELLHASGIPLGLVTNGEHWMVVYAPRGETSGFASWYADIWMQEPITLRAFHSLLCLRRFFGVAAGETLQALYAESAKDQQEVTDQLGRQVRRAVEMLVAAFDQIDDDSGRTLLTGVPEKEVYDAALTVMMRLVFLFCAEERGLLLLGDSLYDQHYAVSTLRELLRERADQHGEEVLERRHDAWSRLLATFRVVHGGVQHESMRLPAYGGSLFDPDRYPFLEGREKDTRWRETPSQPLPVNNRVVLHLLEALQILRVRVPGGGPAEARRVSFRALDIEQIGHVYEGLLDHTARRADQLYLGLSGKHEPEIPLSKLEELFGIDPANFADRESVSPGAGLLAAESHEAHTLPFPARPVSYQNFIAPPAALIEFLKEETGRSAKALESALGYGTPKPRGRQPKATPEGQSKIQNPQSSIGNQSYDHHSLLLACGQDPRLARRVAPFAGLLRRDDFGRLAVIRPGAVFVTAGTDRRSSGTHYTPKSLTEPIVKHTLDPLVYVGPAEGLPEAEWKLKSPAEILALKICDLAMGSGAFLVQVCRYLADRLCEAWELAEKDHAGSILITPDGKFSAGSSAERILPADSAERVALARRYVADRCLYGVDINPMAVEMAKLSLWLITLQKDRPFTFLDHALKCGDSLLGVSDVKQIENFSLRPGDRQMTFATANLFRYIEEAAAKRRALEDLPSNDHAQIETKNRLHAEAEAATAKVKAIADCLIALELRGLDGKAYEEQRAEEAEKVQRLMQLDADEGRKSEIGNFKSALAAHAQKQLRERRPFHWVVEFPEVFGRGGFDAFIGNPPFMGGRKIRGAQGGDYLNYLVSVLEPNGSGNADFCTFFFLRAFGLLLNLGNLGLLAPNTIAEGDSRATGLERMLARGGRIYCADDDREWPGIAGVTVAVVHLSKSANSVTCVLEGKIVTEITPSLKAVSVSEKIKRLRANEDRCFQGSVLAAKGFILSLEEAERLVAQDQRNQNVIVPYYTGDEVFNLPALTPQRMVINFKDWTREKAEQFPSVFAIVEDTVQPVRALVNRQSHRDKWWHYGDKRPALYAALSGLERALVQTHHTKFLCPQFAPTDGVFSHSVVVFPSDDYAMYLILNCCLHDAWARETSGSIRSELRYTPTDCLYSFPFPEWNTGSPLSDIGKRLETCRSEAKKSRSIGMTELMNVLHDCNEHSEDIGRLRALHVEMDHAVAVAYGWGDLDLGHGFHETKQGIRYTLSEPARREVLDRLLALNHQRHAEELAAGLHEKKSKKKAGTAKKAATKRGRKAKVTTTSTSIPAMPSDFRFPAPTPQLYAINLITALLSARAEGLAWTALRDAFVAATSPDLIRRLALPEDKDRVSAWASRWNERATPGLLIPTLRDMGSANIAVEGTGTNAIFSLQDGPQEPATEDVGYDAWLALRVTEPLTTPVLAEAESATLDAEIEALLATL